MSAALPPPDPRTHIFVISALMLCFVIAYICGQYNIALFAALAALLVALTS